MLFFVLSKIPLSAINCGLFGGHEYYIIFFFFGQLVTIVFFPVHLYVLVSDSKILFPFGDMHFLVYNVRAFTYLLSLPYSVLVIRLYLDPVSLLFVYDNLDGILFALRAANLLS